MIALLQSDQLLTHPMVVGELACGTPPGRRQFLSDLRSLEQAQLATLDDVTELVERDELFGRGCGLVDMELLASTRLTPAAVIWTLDRRLAGLAEALKILHRPALH